MHPFVSPATHSAFTAFSWTPGLTGMNESVPALRVPTWLVRTALSQALGSCGGSRGGAGQGTVYSVSGSHVVSPLVCVSHRQNHHPPPPTPGQGLAFHSSGLPHTVAKQGWELSRRPINTGWVTESSLLLPPPFIPFCCWLRHLASLPVCGPNLLTCPAPG